MKVKIKVRLKEGLLNPEAKTIERSLSLLGYDDVSGFDTEKIFIFEVSDKPEEEAKRQADEMCRRLLVNPVIQDYDITVI